jgi:tungstate transport system permease protein
VEAIWDGLREALRLILTGDQTLRDIAFRTLLVSGTATTLAAAAAVPVAYALSRRQFRGRTLTMGALNTGLGLPPVIVGLVVWILLVRSGPLGDLNLVYTRSGMILAQASMAFPIIVALGTAAFQSLPSELPDLLRVLGAGRLRTLWLLSKEARLGLVAAVIAGFGAAISEVGASMIVGGNLQASTRVLTTAIVTETSRGQNGIAMAYGIVLLALAFIVTAGLTALQQRYRAR